VAGQIHDWPVKTENLLGRLGEAQRRAAARLAAAFHAEGAALYLVGGAVRSLLLDQAPYDLDFTTDAVPGQIRTAAERAGATAIYSANERFATVGLVLEGEAIEITSFRAEDAPADILADLARRDFTINALALPVVVASGSEATLIDPFDGAGDLARHTIRAVADPGDRFTEDPLRLVRAVRFAAELDYIIEPETRAAMLNLAPTLQRVSPERIGNELTRLLAAPAVATGLQLLDRLGLLAEALPELLPLVQFAAPGSKQLWMHTQIVVAGTPTRPAVRWAALLHDIAKPRTFSVQDGDVHFFGHELLGARLARGLLSRLKQPRDLVDAVRVLIELHGRPAQYGPDWTDGAVRRLMLDVGDHLDDLLALARADVTSGRQSVRERAWRRIDGLAAHCAHLLAEQELGKLQSPLDGTQLMALFDRPPGPWIRPLKDHLRALVIDGALAPGDEVGATTEARCWMAAREGQTAE
jgi:poly(A) polymerase